AAPSRLARLSRPEESAAAWPARLVWLGRRRESATARPAAPSRRACLGWPEEPAKARLGAALLVARARPVAGRMRARRGLGWLRRRVRGRPNPSRIVRLRARGLARSGTQFHASSGVFATDTGADQRVSAICASLSTLLIGTAGLVRRLAAALIRQL